MLHQIYSSRAYSAALVCLSVVGLLEHSPANAGCPDPKSLTNTCLGDGALESNTDGSYNTAVGYLALRENTTGFENTALGFHALIGNTTGVFNTAVGGAALANNSTGNSNTANGYRALEINTVGRLNTALGTNALQHNISGNENTAVGMASLDDNSSGEANTATGFFALRFNQTGNFNTATGVEALYSGIGFTAGTGSASNNTANGYRALYSNDTGESNTATGVNALLDNTHGFYNTANGTGALKHSTTGYRNVGLGYQAGYNISSGSDNIVIGGGNRGRATENGVIRIGSSEFQTQAFIAGIRGVTTGLSSTAVFIDSHGQLGTIRSSREAKEDIQPMGSVSERLLALRPVTFRYKVPDVDGGQPIQFGLIAEEVADVFPELVIYSEDGKPETVSYHLLATLLLNEFQKERSKTQAELMELKAVVAKMAALIERMDPGQTIAATR